MDNALERRTLCTGVYQQSNFLLSPGREKSNIISESRSSNRCAQIPVLMILTIKMGSMMPLTMYLMRLLYSMSVKVKKVCSLSYGLRSGVNFSPSSTFGSSQSFQFSGSRITGIRLWIGCISSLGCVMMIADDLMVPPLHKAECN